MAVYVEDKSFVGMDFTVEPLVMADYENCCFTTCNFASVDLSHFKFIECDFNGCDLSNAKLDNSTFQEVRFEDCKLLGLLFSSCCKFLLSFGFKSCNLSLSSFYQLRLKNTRFEKCEMTELDFVETDLTGAVFDECNLHGSVFERSILVQADFRTASHYSINPALNRIKKARFSRAGIDGLLDTYDIRIE